MTALLMDLMELWLAAVRVSLMAQLLGGYAVALLEKS
jgi:hypothetical protein